MKTIEKPYSIHFTEEDWCRLHDAVGEIMEDSNLSDEGKHIIKKTIADEMDKIAACQKIDEDMLRNAY